MTEGSLDTKPGFWGQLFTAPRLASFGLMFALAAFTMGVSYAGLKNDIQSLRGRMNAIEIIIPRDYQPRETLNWQLQSIRDEQARMRAAQERFTEAINQLRKDLR